MVSPSSNFPSATSYTEDVFIEKQTNMIQNIQSEYCFYEARYKYALDKLFSAVKSGYLTNSPDIQKSIQSILSITQTLNLRLNDLTQIINTISEDMLYTSNSLQEEIKQYNDKIQKQREKLDYQNSIIFLFKREKYSYCVTVRQCDSATGSYSAVQRNYCTLGVNSATELYVNIWHCRVNRASSRDEK